MAVVVDPPINGMELKDQRQPAQGWSVSVDISQEPAVNTVSQSLLDAPDFVNEPVGARWLFVFVRTRDLLSKS
jgi:hypothetical protein